MNGVKMKNFIEYDEEADTLILRKENEKVEESINDRYICLLELNKEKQIIGLEFLGFRKTFNIPLDVLNNVKDSEVLIRYEHKAKILYINVKLKYQKEKETIAIPVNFDMGKEDFILSNFEEASAAV
jgi:uncharacterized protein YuzE